MSLTSRLKFLAVSLILLALPAWGQVASRTFETSTPDYLDVGDILGSVFHDANAKFTIALWAKFDETSRSTQDALVIKYGAGGSCIGEREFYFLVTNAHCSPAVNDALVFGTIQQSDTGNSAVACSATDAVADTDWHFLAATADFTQSVNANKVEVYIDGVFATNDVDGQGSDFDLEDTGANVGFGGYLDSVSAVCNPTQHMDGEIAYIHIYNRLLTADEQKSLMTCPGFISDGLIGFWPLTDSTTQYDFSGNGNDGANNGTAASTDGPPVSNCALLGGN